MLKLLLCSALVTPCFLLSFAGTYTSPSAAYKKTSFNEAFVEPEFEKLENCSSAKLDVFFHENYITTHSAEYIADGIHLSKTCGTANYIITPVIPSASHVKADDILINHIQELLLVLKAHGIQASVAAAEIQRDYNSLSANGRTATLEIAFAEGKSS